MEKIKVNVNGTVVLEYNSKLFEQHLHEILARTMGEVGAVCASKDEIVLRDFADLSKLNNLMISYLA